MRRKYDTVQRAWYDGQCVEVYSRPAFTCCCLHNSWQGRLAPHRPPTAAATADVNLFCICFVQVIVFVFVFCPKWLTDRSKYGKCVTLSNAAASAAGKSYRWALKAFCSGDLWQQAGNAFIRRQKGSTNDSIAIFANKVTSVKSQQ